MRIQNTPFGRNPFKRSVAILTAALFVFTGISNYTPAAFAKSAHNIQAQGGGPSEHLLRLARDREIRIPPELGKIDEVYFADGAQRMADGVRAGLSPSSIRHPISGRKTIVFLQDAHDSLEAQENIAKIIKLLTEQYGVRTVFEEGYEGPVPTDEYFGFIKDPAIKQKVSWFFLDKLRLHAAEYAHINRTAYGVRGTANKNSVLRDAVHLPPSADWQLIGADSLKLHKENIDQYRLSATKKEVITKDLKTLEKELKTLADNRFPKELKEWLKLKEQFDAKKLDLFTYLARTMPLVRSEAYGVRRIKDGEGVAGKNSPYAVHLTPLLEFILEVVKTNDPAVIEKAKHIDAREIYAELIKLEKTMSEAYLKNAADKELFGYCKILGLLARLNDLQVTQEEYEALRSSLEPGVQSSENFSELRTQSAELFSTQGLAEFIHKQTGKPLVLSKQWERNIQEAVKFYEIAQTRDNSLESALDKYFLGKTNDHRPETRDQRPETIDHESRQSIVDSLQSPKTSTETAVLVFGGFHKENIKRILESKGISYVVVSPRITKPSPRHEEYYRRLMTQGFHSFELPFVLRTATAPQSLTEMPLSLARAEIRAAYDAISRGVQPEVLDRVIVSEDQNLSTRSEVRNGETKPELNQEQLHQEVLGFVQRIRALEDGRNIFPKFMENLEQDSFERIFQKWRLFYALRQAPEMLMEEMLRAKLSGTIQNLLIIILSNWNNYQSATDEALVRWVLEFRVAEAPETKEVSRQIIFRNPKHLHVRPSIILTHFAMLLSTSRSVSIEIQKGNGERITVASTQFLSLLSLEILSGDALNVFVKGDYSSAILNAVLNKFEQLCQDSKTLEGGLFKEDPIQAYRVWLDDDLNFQSSDSTARAEMRNNIGQKLGTDSRQQRNRAAGVGFETAEAKLQLLEDFRRVMIGHGRSLGDSVEKFDAQLASAKRNVHGSLAGVEGNLRYVFYPITEGSVSGPATVDRLPGFLIVAINGNGEIAGYGTGALQPRGPKISFTFNIFEEYAGRGYGQQLLDAILKETNNIPLEEGTVPVVAWGFITGALKEDVRRETVRRGTLPFLVRNGFLPYRLNVPDPELLPAQRALLERIQTGESIHWQDESIINEFLPLTECVFVKLRSEVRGLTDEGFGVKTQIPFNVPQEAIIAQDSRIGKIVDARKWFEEARGFRNRQTDAAVLSTLTDELAGLERARFPYEKKNVRDYGNVKTWMDRLAGRHDVLLLLDQENKLAGFLLEEARLLPGSFREYTRYYVNLFGWKITQPFIVRTVKAVQTAINEVFRGFHNLLGWKWIGKIQIKWLRSSRERLAGAVLKRIATRVDGIKGKGTFLMDVYLDRLRREGILNVHWYATNLSAEFYQRYLWAAKKKGIVAIYNDPIQEPNHTVYRGKFLINGEMEKLWAYLYIAELAPADSKAQPDGVRQGGERQEVRSNPPSKQGGSNLNNRAEMRNQTELTTDKVGAHVVDVVVSNDLVQQMVFEDADGHRLIFRFNLSTADDPSTLNPIYDIFMGKDIENNFYDYISFVTTQEGYIDAERTLENFGGHKTRERLNPWLWPLLNSAINLLNETRLVPENPLFPKETVREHPASHVFTYPIQKYMAPDDPELIRDFKYVLDAAMREMLALESFLPEEEWYEAIQKGLFSEFEKQEIYRELKSYFGKIGLSRKLKAAGITQFTIYPVSGMAPNRVAVKKHSDIDLAMIVQGNAYDKAAEILQALSPNHPALDLERFHKVFSFPLSRALSRLGAVEGVEINLYSTDDPADNDTRLLFFNFNNPSLPVAPILQEGTTVQEEADRLRKKIYERVQKRGIAEESIVTIRGLHFMWKEMLARDLYHLRKIIGLGSFAGHPWPGVDLKAIESETLREAGSAKKELEEFFDDVIRYRGSFSLDVSREIGIGRRDAIDRDDEMFVYREMPMLAYLLWGATRASLDKIDEQRIKKALRYYRELKEQSIARGQLSPFPALINRLESMYNPSRKHWAYGTLRRLVEKRNAYDEIFLNCSTEFMLFLLLLDFVEQTEKPNLAASLKDAPLSKSRAELRSELTPEQAWTEFHNLYSDSFGGQYRQIFEEFWRPYFDSLPQNGKILDLGSGALFAANAAKKARPDAEVWALDFADIAPARIPKNIHFIRSRAEDMDQTGLPNDLDLVVSQFGIEYMDWAVVLKKLAQKIKPGGKAFFLTHYGDSSLTRKAKIDLEQVEIIKDQKLLEKALAFFRAPSLPENFAVDSRANALVRAFMEVAESYQREVTVNHKGSDYVNVLRWVIEEVQQITRKYENGKFAAADLQRFEDFVRQFERTELLLRERIRAVLDHGRLDRFIEAAKTAGFEVRSPQIKNRRIALAGRLIELKLLYSELRTSSDSRSELRSEPPSRAEMRIPDEALGVDIAPGVYLIEETVYPGLEKLLGLSGKRKITASDFEEFLETVRQKDIRLYKRINKTEAGYRNMEQWFRETPGMMLLRKQAVLENPEEVIGKLGLWTLAVAMNELTDHEKQLVETFAGMVGYFMKREMTHNWDRVAMVQEIITLPSELLKSFEDNLGGAEIIAQLRQALSDVKKRGYEIYQSAVQNLRSIAKTDGRGKWENLVRSVARQMVGDGIFLSFESDPVVGWLDSLDWTQIKSEREFQSQVPPGVKAAFFEGEEFLPDFLNRLWKAISANRSRPEPRSEPPSRAEMRDVAKIRREVFAPSFEEAKQAILKGELYTNASYAKPVEFRKFPGTKVSLWERVASRSGVPAILHSLSVAVYPDKDAEVMQRLIQLRNDFAKQPFARKFFFIPSEAYHLTLDVFFLQKENFSDQQVNDAKKKVGELAAKTRPFDLHVEGVTVDSADGRIQVEVVLWDGKKPERRVITLFSPYRELTNGEREQLLTWIKQHRDDVFGEFHAEELKLVHARNIFAHQNISVYKYSFPQPNNATYQAQPDGVQRGRVSGQDRSELRAGQPIPSEHGIAQTARGQRTPEQWLVVLLREEAGSQPFKQASKELYRCFDLDIYRELRRSYFLNAKEWSPAKKKAVRFLMSDLRIHWGSLFSSTDRTATGPGRIAFTHDATVKWLQELSAKYPRASLKVWDYATSDGSTTLDWYEHIKKELPGLDITVTASDLLLRYDRVESKQGVGYFDPLSGKIVMFKYKPHYGPRGWEGEVFPGYETGSWRPDDLKEELETAYARKRSVEVYAVDPEFVAAMVLSQGRLQIREEDVFFPRAGDKQLAVIRLCDFLRQPHSKIHKEDFYYLMRTLGKKLIEGGYLLMGEDNILTPKGFIGGEYDQWAGYVAYRRAGNKLLKVTAWPNDAVAEVLYGPWLVPEIDLQWEFKRDMLGAGFERFIDTKVDAVIRSDFFSYLWRWAKRGNIERRLLAEYKKTSENLATKRWRPPAIRRVEAGTPEGDTHRAEMRGEPEAQDPNQSPVPASDPAMDENRENGELSSIFQEMSHLLSSVDGKAIRREDVTPKLIELLSDINRHGTPVFNKKQIQKVGRLRKLEERLSLFRYLLVYGEDVQGKRKFTFQGTHIEKIFKSSRSEAEIRTVIGVLKELGIKESSPVAMILQSSRSEAEIRRVIGVLKKLGITESSPVAKILQSSRSEAEIRRVIGVLKGLGIRESNPVAMILKSSRSEAEIQTVIGVLKKLGITESSPVAMILQSSRSEAEIRRVIGVLKGLGITESSPVAMILQSSRSETEIRRVIGALKDLRITESSPVAMILKSSRSEAEIRTVIGALKDLGITESSPVAMILQSSRSEAEIRTVIGALKDLRITESSPVAKILQSSRFEAEIRTVIGVLKGLGITESSPVAMILQSSRSEAGIRRVIGVLKDLGIKESYPVAVILYSSRSETEIRRVIGVLKGLGITESNPVAMILQSSRSEAEIRRVIGVLKDLGITESSPVAMILHSSRSEAEIQTVIGALKELGVRESYPVAMILQSSRSETEIRTVIGVLKGLGITESNPVAKILHSSRSEAEIQTVIGALKELGITESSPVAMILHSSQLIKNFDVLNKYKRNMEEKQFSDHFIQYVLLRLALSKSPEKLFEMIIEFDFNTAKLQAEQMPISTTRSQFEEAFGGMGIWLLKFLGKDFRSLRAVIRGYAKELLLLDILPEGIDSDRIMALSSPSRADEDLELVWKFLEPLIAGLSPEEQSAVDAFLEGATEDEIGRKYRKISFPEILAKLKILIEEGFGAEGRRADPPPLGGDGSARAEMRGEPEAQDPNQSPVSNPARPFDHVMADRLLDNDLIRKRLSERAQYETDRAWVKKFLLLRGSDRVAREVFEDVDRLDPENRIREAGAVIQTTPSKENHYYGLAQHKKSVLKGWTFEQWARNPFPTEGFIQLVVRDINWCFLEDRFVFRDEQGVRNNIRSLYIVIRAFDDLARRQSGEKVRREEDPFDRAMAEFPYEELFPLVGLPPAIAQHGTESTAVLAQKIWDGEIKAVWGENFDVFVVNEMFRYSREKRQKSKQALVTPAVHQKWNAILFQAYLGATEHSGKFRDFLPVLKRFEPEGSLDALERENTVLARVFAAIQSSVFEDASRKAQLWEWLEYVYSTMIFPLEAYFYARKGLEHVYLDESNVFWTPVLGLGSDVLDEAQSDALRARAGTIQRKGCMLGRIVRGEIEHDKGLLRLNLEHRDPSVREQISLLEKLVADGRFPAANRLLHDPEIAPLVAALKSDNAGEETKSKQSSGDALHPERPRSEARIQAMDDKAPAGAPAQRMAVQLSKLSAPDRQVSVAPSLKMKTPAVFVIEKKRLEAMSRSGLHQLMGFVAINKDKLWLVVPDMLEGKESRFLADLRTLGVRISLDLPEVARDPKVQVIGLSDKEHDTAAAFQKRLSPRLAKSVKEYFALEGGEGVFLALLVAKPEELSVKNGFLYDKSGRYHAGLRAVLQNLMASYVVISSAA